MSVIEEIAAERERQCAAEGWTPEHDDGHTEGQLAAAAAAYADIAARHVANVPQGGAFYRSLPPFIRWPWETSWWKPKNARRDLIRAAALIVAEVERLDRAADRHATAI